MTLHVQQASRPVAAAGFDVRSARCDATRAHIYLNGHLDEDAAAVLAEVIDSHVRSGRRFLRLYVGGVRSLEPAAIEVITIAHRRLLAAKGTMILTGVGAAIEAALRSAPAGSDLFLLPPTAADLRS